MLRAFYALIMRKYHLFGPKGAYPVYAQIAPNGVILLISRRVPSRANMSMSCQPQDCSVAYNIIVIKEFLLLLHDIIL